ncbi:MAG: hypothetical protein HUJ91_04260, partial [Bacteroidales bacterium]|nr:hypothetical protein [Bacteroidales bacterium]
VKSVTELTSLHGEYAVSERVTYDGRNLVSCTVTAGGVTYASDIVSSFKHVTATIDVMDNLQVLVNCEASIPDMFLTDWTKDYVTKLQEYIDKNVDVKVYLTHSSDAPQAEIRLRVEKTGAPLFGKIQVVPYIYFAADDTTCELDAYFQSASALPDVIRCLEDLLGNIRIEY